MRTTGSAVDGGRGWQVAWPDERQQSLYVGSVAAQLYCTFGILTLKRQRPTAPGGGRSPATLAALIARQHDSQSAAGPRSPVMMPCAEIGKGDPGVSRPIGTHMA